MGNVTWMFFQEGRSSKLRLRRGVEQATHARSNSHVKCTGAYCAQTLNNADTNELYGVPLSLIVVLFITTLTHLPDSFKVVGHLSFEILLQTATGEQGSYCYVLEPSHCSRDKRLARPLINKKK